MTASHITELWIERRLGVLTLCGDLLALDELGAVAGYGLEGQLVAASASARAGINGAFVRREPKSHGTRRRIDGALAPCEIASILCPQGEEDACANLLTDLDMDHAEITTFNVKTTTQAFSRLQGFDAIPCADHESLRDTVVLLEGRFTLSSGREAEAYWETLPAANTFSVARNLNLGALRRETPLLGVGHGGAYLATVSSLVRAQQPVIVDPNSRIDEVFGTPAVLLDDFVTTGTAFERCLGALTPQARAESRRVSLYASEEAAVLLPEITVMQELPPIGVPST
jgi:orotate phosphoribosyltransferase